jgi:putative flippase GtrA
MTNNIVENILKLLKGEFIKFVFVGGISAVIEFSLLILFVEKMGVDYLIGNIGAFALTNIVTYILSKRYVFNASTSVNKAQEAGLFFLCLLGGLVVNQIVLWALVEFTSVDYRIAKVIAIAITVIWNFFTRKHLVFRNRAVATVEQPAPTEYSEENL